MTVGTVFDRTMNFNYAQKKITGQDEPLNVLEGYMERHFHEEKSKVSWDVDLGAATEKAQDKTINALSRGIKKFRSDICPRVEPHYVQLEVRDTIAPGLDLSGTLIWLRGQISL